MPDKREITIPYTVRLPQSLAGWVEQHGGRELVKYLVMNAWYQANSSPVPTTDIPDYQDAATTNTPS